jgi:drug/metabolite transporter (DMT)-like permease
LAVLLWGFTGVLGRAIRLDAPVLVWYRMLFTAMIMAGILTYRKQWMPVAYKDLRLLIGVGCLMGLHWVAFYGSIQLANTSVALVCLSTASVFTALLDPLINKSKHKLPELVLGFLALLGVYLIYRFQQLFGMGILLGITAAMISAVFTVLNKRIADKYPARTMVFYEMSTGWIFVSLLLPVQFYVFPNTRFLPHTANLFGQHWFQNDWLWLLILSLCCTVWAQSLALTALKRLSAFTVTLSVNLEPVYGTLLAILFYQENKELNSGFYWGMGLIFLSVVVQMLWIIRPAFSSGFIREKGGIE